MYTDRIIIIIILGIMAWQHYQHIQHINALEDWVEGFVQAMEEEYEKMNKGE